MQPLPSKPSTSSQASQSQEALAVSQQDKEKISPTMPSEQENTVSHSTTRQEIHQYIEIMTELPDIRKERIAQIQAAIASDIYSVSSEDLADKLVQDLST